MSSKILSAAIVAVSALSAIGCAGGDLKRRVDELTLENEDLARQKSQVEADLLASQARCEALERGRASVAPTPYEPPSGLQVDVRRQGNDTVIEIPADLFFASGSSTLSGPGERAMKQVMDILRQHPSAGLIKVQGHSDTDPIRRTKGKYHCNWELSFERAHSVMHHLIERGGVDPRRVACEALGEHHPRVPGDKARNRRVEIVVSP